MIVSKISFNPYNTSISNRYINKSYVSQNFAFTSDKTENENSENKSSSVKILASVAIAALLTGLALIGKRVRNNHILKQIPEDFQKIFKRLKGKKWKEFIDCAYSEMRSYMGLQEIAPEKVLIEGQNGLYRVTGGYLVPYNIIKFSSGITFALPKEKQIGMIAHELTHAKQYNIILRTEGLGADALADAIAESYIKNAMNSDFDAKFYLAYQNAKKIGKEKEFLKTQHNIWKQKFEENILENHKKVLSMPKYKPDSPEGKKAQEYLQAQRIYEFLPPSGIGSINYHNNPLEIEAYGYGDKIEKLYKKYLSLW